jgi:hypothetical protein
VFKAGGRRAVAEIIPDPDCTFRWRAWYPSGELSEPTDIAGAGQPVERAVIEMASERSGAFAGRGVIMVTIPRHKLILLLPQQPKRPTAASSSILFSTSRSIKPSGVMLFARRWIRPTRRGPRIGTRSQKFPTKRSRSSAIIASTFDPSTPSRRASGKKAMPANLKIWRR